MTFRAQTNNLRSGGPFSFFVPPKRAPDRRLTSRRGDIVNCEVDNRIKSLYNALTYSFKWGISHRHLKYRCYLRNYAL